MGRGIGSGRCRIIWERRCRPGWWSWCSGCGRWGRARPTRSRRGSRTQLRRVGGYNIEVLTPAARREGRENLARLLVGSEGTLAFSAALELDLQPVLPRKMLGICQFPTFSGGDGGVASTWWRWGRRRWSW